jgi:hypothetical protein
VAACQRESIAVKRVTKYFLYFVFLLATAEFSSRLFLSIPFVVNLMVFNEDVSWHRSWVHRHQNSKEIRYILGRYDPTKGWLATSNLRDAQVWKDRTLNTNSRGLRGKTEYSYDKHSNKPRILILGDSFTFGNHVSDNETYSHYLQETMPNVEIVNMGVYGYGHDQMLILFKEEGVKYKPDIVILGFLHMDMSRNRLQFRDYAKPRYVVDSGKLKLIGSPVPHPEYVLKRDWARPRIYDILSIIIHGFKKLVGLENKEEEILTSHILNEMIEVADNIHAIPIFVYLPAGEEITAQTPLTYGEKFLFSLCQTNDKVRCFSSRPYFAEEIAKGTIFKLRGGHWEPSCHLVIAKAIMGYLTNSTVIGN